jgi:protein arginine kinase
MTVRRDAVPAWLCGQGPEASIVLSTRVRLARNVANHRFTSCASATERGELFAEVAATLEKDSQLAEYECINFGSVSSLCRQLLVEKRIASPELLPERGDRGVAWSGEPFSSILINEEDHLRIQCLEGGCDPLLAWKRADEIDDRLGSGLKFAYTEQRGYLTCRPGEAGTGLRVSFLMHLPGLVLTRAIEAVLSGASRMGMASRGFFGEREVIGNFFQLSSQPAFVEDERGCLDAAKRVALEVVAHERSARQRLLKDARLEVTDKVFRALGILQQAQMLSVAEFMNLSSALRLGIECGILSGLAPEGLNRALVQVMPAHLRQGANKRLSETDLAVMRAGAVRKMVLQKIRKRRTAT